MFAGLISKCNNPLSFIGLTPYSIKEINFLFIVENFSIKLSSVKPDDFKQRLISNEVDMLTSLPGIGPKTARRIIVELKDKFITTSENELPIENVNNLNSDVLSALLNLGYRTNDINRALNKVDMNLNIEDKIKEALKILR